jgi:ribosomal RNA small subunit methyltransferase A
LEREALKAEPLFDKRPEMLSVAEFITLTQWLSAPLS